MDVRVKNALTQAYEDAIGGPPSPEMIGGAYEGAERLDTATALWSPPLQSADADLIPDKPVLDARVRDMVNNDGYVRSGMTFHRDAIVGARYVLNATPNIKVLGLDDTWAREFQEEVEAKFTLWAESPSAYPDAAGEMTLTEIVRLAIGVTLASGEFLMHSTWRRSGTRPYRTTFQVIDPDRLGTPFEYQDDDRVRGGVRVSKTRRPLGFYIWKKHPGDTMLASPDEWQYIPASYPWGRRRMVYIREQTRPEQTRGVSELVSGLLEMRLLKDFRKITLMNAVANASFAATIESELPTEVALASIGAGSAPDAVVGAATKYLAAVSEYTKSARNIQIDGVKIPHLFPGSKLNLQPAGKIGGVGQDFEASLIRYLAAILGLSGEQLSRDYSQTNMSSAKAGMAQTQRHFRARKRFIADRVANEIYRAWFEEAANKRPQDGGLETMQGRSIPNIYEGLNFDAYTEGQWLGAARDNLDELREMQAALLRVKAGISTRRDEARRLGKDWREVFAQLAREEKVAEDLGLHISAQDKSLNAASGSPRDMKDDDGGLKTPKEVKDAEGTD